MLQLFGLGLSAISPWNQQEQERDGGDAGDKGSYNFCQGDDTGFHRRGSLNQGEQVFNRKREILSGGRKAGCLEFRSVA